MPLGGPCAIGRRAKGGMSPKKVPASLASERPALSKELTPPSYHGRFYDNLTEKEIRTLSSGLLPSLQVLTNSLALPGNGKQLLTQHPHLLIVTDTVAPARQLKIQNGERPRKSERGV